MEGLAEGVEMMADLISRAAAIECAIDAVDDWDGGWNPNRETVIRKYFEELPAVDAVPVVHGRWINYPECLRYESAYCEEDIVCSECHSVWNIIDNDADRFDHCPACGAKMDGDT